MSAAGLASRVESVRRFNRFYTKQIGVLDEGILKSPFSLTQVRVLYELAHSRAAAATDLRKDLGLDAGYVSRLLATFERTGLLRSQTSVEDARRHVLALTGKGRRTFQPLEARSKRDIARMLERLSLPRQRRLIEAMDEIARLLGEETGSPAPVVLRALRPGDLGWVVHRHGALYAAEYGWDERFEALVAGIVASFIESFDPRRERCWIAERQGEILGSVFLVRKSRRVAKLRLLYVEPTARGLGLGARLVGECVRFAREASYGKIVLWTQSVLVAARHIYKKEGFRLVARKRHTSFGRRLVAETWELAL